MGENKVMQETGVSKSAPQVVIYTDGGCEPNPGIGGWAVVLIAGNREKELSGGNPNSTNNRMEMTAAIKALEALKRPCSVQLHSDSKYLITGITCWIHKWKRNHWMRGGKPVLNADLWRRLDELCQLHHVEWIWVQGHAGNKYNERCDQLAQCAIAAHKTFPDDSGFPDSNPGD